MKKSLAWLFYLPLLLPVQGDGHHSVYGEFSRDKPLAFSGTLEKIDWVNPHVLISIKDDETGITWQLEVQGIAALGMKGWQGDELAPGVHLDVQGGWLNVRDNSTLACCAHIYDADGYEYYTGQALASDREEGLVRKGLNTATRKED